MILVGGVLAIGLLRSIRRSVHNAEEVTNIIANKVARPLSNIPGLAEVARTVLGLVQEYRSRERRNEDGEIE